MHKILLNDITIRKQNFIDEPMGFGGEWIAAMINPLTGDLIKVYFGGKPTKREAYIAIVSEMLEQGARVAVFK